MNACAHKDFVARVDVGRITESVPEEVDIEDVDPHSFIAEVEVRCKECNELFGFKGIDTGFDFDHPTQRIDGKKAHLPLRSPAEMLMAGELAALPAEGRRAARGARLEVKAAGEGEESAILDAVRQRTDSWLAVYKEARANGMDDANAQMHADWRMKEEFDGTWSAGL